MSAEENKALVRRFYEEVWSRRQHSGRMAGRVAPGREHRDSAPLAPKKRSAAHVASRCSPTTTCATTALPASFPGRPDRRRSRTTSTPRSRISSSCIDLIVGGGRLRRAGAGRRRVPISDSWGDARADRHAGDVLRASTSFASKTARSAEIWNHRDDLGLIGAARRAGLMPARAPTSAPASRSPFGDDVQRSRLEALEKLLHARHALVVAGGRSPVLHRVRAHPGAEADERRRALGVAQEPRPRAETLEVAPLDPLLPAPDELVLRCPASRATSCACTSRPSVPPCETAVP